VHRLRDGHRHHRRAGVTAATAARRGPSVAARLARLDWAALESDLAAQGRARTPPLLASDECAALVRLWDEPRRFRARIDMARLRFGVGEYRYFAAPLPPMVAALREATYAHLAPIANRWMEALRSDARYPLQLHDFLAHCHRRGQKEPTPLVLRYQRDGYNCLHRDLYGQIAFPLQATIFLSRREDYTGGEFLLVEQRPRAQSRGEALTFDQGEMLIFPNAVRPAKTTRGTTIRNAVRHGVSTIRSGERWALGLIFHDAK
jgi:hypothetical protein